jgi:hypothetical protein
MQHLRDNIGYRGWRFDFAKGYGSTFIKQYVMDSGAGGDMNVGEFWSDMHWEDGGEPQLYIAMGVHALAARDSTSTLVFLAIVQLCRESASIKAAGRWGITCSL